MTGRVAIVKSAGRADPFAEAIRGAGFTPVLVSPFQVEEVPGAREALAEALASRPAWVAVTSPHAVPVLEGADLRGARVAAVGAGTATAMQSAGFDEIAIVGEAGAESLGAKIVAAGVARGDAVLHPCGEDARADLGRVLAAAGARYVAVPVYRMVEDAVGERAATGAFAAVVVGSPNLARRAADLFPAHPPAIAIGRTTAAALRDLGWPPAAVAARPTPSDVAAALAAALRR